MLRAWLRQAASRGPGGSPTGKTTQQGGKRGGGGQTRDAAFGEATQAVGSLPSARGGQDGPKVTLGDVICCRPICVPKGLQCPPGPARWQQPPPVPGGPGCTCAPGAAPSPAGQWGLPARGPGPAIQGDPGFSPHQDRLECCSFLPKGTPAPRKGWLGRNCSPSGDRHTRPRARA